MIGLAQIHVAIHTRGLGNYSRAIPTQTNALSTCSMLLSGFLLLMGC